MVHTNPAYDENPTLPSPMPPVLKYDMTLCMVPEFTDRMSRETFISAAEVQVEKLAIAMVNKMVEEYDERHKKEASNDTANHS